MKIGFERKGAIAEFERARIVERVRAGIVRAKTQGRRLGRRPTRITDDQLASVEHLSERKAAAALGIPRSVLQRARVARNPSESAPIFAPVLTQVSNCAGVAR